MPNYKVGDVASLFPTPTYAKNKKNIQDLFNEHNSKHQYGKSHFKNKGLKIDESTKVADMSVSEKKSNKKKIISSEYKRTKKDKSKQNNSLETDFINPEQKNTHKKRKFENDFQESHKMSGEFNIEPPQQMNKRVKKFEDASEDKNTLVKKQRKKKNKSSALGENHEGFNKSSKIRIDAEDSSDTPQQVNKHMKKLEDVSEDEKMPIKRQKKKKKSDNHNKSHEEINNSSELGNDAKDINSKDNDDLQCTLFVGNLPLNINRKELQRLFCPFGLLKTVRVRGAIPCKSTIPKKIAEITNKYHENVQSHKGFVVFRDRDSAEKALALNGTLLDNHHIIVDFANNVGEKKIYDEKLSIFVGNLPFDVSDEAVWSAFEVCGDIQAVRIIRDRDSGVGKGFGYVLFKNSTSRQKALALEELQISGRNIRIKAVENNTNKSRGSRDALKAIRKNVAIKRSKDNTGKKSVKKLLKKGRRIHHNKQVARMLGEKFVK